MSVNDSAVKKKRKSSAEKFLEDNSEYYGFQVLPSKLRSSSSVESFPFFDYLRRRAPTNDDHDDDDDGQLVSHKNTVQNTVLFRLTIIERCDTLFSQACCLLLDTLLLLKGAATLYLSFLFLLFILENCSFFVPFFRKLKRNPALEEDLVQPVKTWMTNSKCVIAQDIVVVLR